MKISLVAWSGFVFQKSHSFILLLESYFGWVENSRLAVIFLKYSLSFDSTVAFEKSTVSTWKVLFPFSVTVFKIFLLVFHFSGVSLWYSQVCISLYLFCLGFLNLWIGVFQILSQDLFHCCLCPFSLFIFSFWDSSWT